MKKIVLLIGVIFCLTGCLDVFKSKPVKQIEEPKTEEKEEIVEEVYEDNNQIKVGLYDNTGNKFNIYKSYNKKMSPDVDLDYYQIVFSDDEEVTFSGNREDYIKSLWDGIETPFTLGIILEYETKNDGLIKHVIYKPDNTLQYQDYIGVYLYDAVSHKYDKWYSHITPEEFNDNTYITSFKITPGSRIEEITSPIKVSVFTYDTEDDFDKDGNYRGNSIYTIEITNS